MTRNQAPLPELISRRQAWTMLGVSRSTFDKMVRKGLVEKLKIEGTTAVRFRRSDVRRLARSK